MQFFLRASQLFELHLSNLLSRIETKNFFISFKFHEEKL